METMQEAIGNPTTPITMRQLLEAGVHFGHNTGRWNPKMKQFIFGARNGIHIIDLQHTVKLFRQAFQAVVDTTSRGDTILFVGTKKQAQDVIVEEATRSSQHYVTQRWLGGTLTNFKTVKGSLERLRGLEKMEEDGTLFALTKRAQVMIRRDRDKPLKSLGGIKGIERLLGYERIERLGKKIEILVPERYRGKHPGHRTEYFHEPKVRSMGSGLELHGRMAAVQ